MLFDDIKYNFMNENKEKIDKNRSHFHDLCCMKLNDTVLLCREDSRMACDTGFWKKTLSV